MKPRPFYKWKSFWLGVVVLVFMGWAAWKSRSEDHVLTAAGDRWCVQVVKMESRTAVVTGPPWAMVFHATRGVSYHAMSRDPVSFVPVLEDMRPLGLRFVMVPDRLLFFSFLGLWLAGMIWQWSREQKKLE